MSPAALVKEAARAGLAAVSLTDHDTMAGTVEASSAALEVGIEFVSGIEISANHNGKAVHILGYGLSEDNPQLLSLLAELQSIRNIRNRKILEKLASLGITITPDELSAAAGDLAGRPHIAHLLIKHGIVSTIDQAFRKFLRKNCSAYVEAAKFPAAETIRIINQAGGVSVLAHPFTIDKSLVSVPAVIREMKLAGLGGIEAFYPGHSTMTCRRFLELAADLDLLVTGGSDFHGAMKPDLKIGGAPVMPPVPYRFMEKLNDRLGIHAK